MNKKINSYNIGVAAEAFAAGQFARFGYDISVQYGANQPEYDLIAHKDDMILKVQVKGSQDRGWGLTQNYKKNKTYHEAIDDWLSTHSKKTIFCLVQFANTKDDEIPRLYLATPSEIASQMKKARGGKGDTILHENYTYKNGVAAGVTDKLPDEWKFTKGRVEQLFLFNAV